MAEPKGEGTGIVVEKLDKKSADHESRSRKSKNAFRTISEVSEALNVPQHVLRFWETKFSQIKPMKRGGGRRYYRPEDIHLLRGVRELLYDDGYTIKGVQKLLREGGVRVLQDRAQGTAPEAAAETSEAATESVAPEPVAAATNDPDTQRILVDVLKELEDLKSLLSGQT
jgi:DNA-binding transcriptional MerR regulator